MEIWSVKGKARTQPNLEELGVIGKERDVPGSQGFEPVAIGYYN